MLLVGRRRGVRGGGSSSYNCSSGEMSGLLFTGPGGPGPISSVSVVSGAAPGAGEGARGGTGVASSSSVTGKSYGVRIVSSSL